MFPLANSTAYQVNLDALRDQSALCLTFNRGIEKEGLRVNPNGSISQLGHSTALGSALTHPSITTDYSEALLEFISPVRSSAQEVLNFLHDAHAFTLRQLDDEVIWPASMPCPIHDELDVPIAQYGTSNLGQMKHVYRKGLWHRYGRIMQCIAGLHYNFSANPELWKVLADQCGQAPTQDFISARYFGLIRNFRRFSWLLLYLFGASPTIDKSFVEGKEHHLEKWDDETFFLPYATSLRMSGLGYQNNAQSDLFVCFNSVPTYTQTLREAIKLPYAPYRDIGVIKNGEYQQLNDHLLQIENEYYADVRPKRTSKNGEKPLTALDRYGVEYIEVRCLDLNPFMPLGIDEEQVHFMYLFLAYCLLEESPALSDKECQEVTQNQRRIVEQGRDPEFKLYRHGQARGVAQWGAELVAKLKPLAQIMEHQQSGIRDESILNKMAARLDDPSQTPSAKVLAELKSSGDSFSEFSLKQAKKFHSDFVNSEIDEAKWKKLAQTSLHQQDEIEKSDDQDFATYLTAYLKAM